MLPVARACPSLFSVTSSGKFHGTMAPTTPTGSFQIWRVLAVPRRSTISLQVGPPGELVDELDRVAQRAVQRDVELVGVGGHARAADLEDELLAQLLALLLERLLQLGEAALAQLAVGGPVGLVEGPPGARRWPGASRRSTPSATWPEHLFGGGVDVVEGLARVGLRRACRRRASAASWLAAAVMPDPLSLSGFSRSGNPIIKKCHQHNRAVGVRAAPPRSTLRAGRRRAACRVAGCRCPAGVVRTLPAPSSWSSTIVRRTKRCSGCSVGEADAGQHLLAVPGHGAGRPPGERLGHARPSPGRGPPRRRRAARRPPRRRPGCRPGGGARPGSVPMGRPNCMRSSACGRASSSMARAGADELVPERELAQRPPRRPSRPARAGAVGPASNVARHLEQAERGVEALHRPALQRRGRHGERRGARRPVAATTSAVSERPSAAVPRPCDHAPVRRRRAPVASHVAQRGQDDARVADGGTVPSAAASSQSSAAEVALRRPWHSKSTETAVGRSAVERVAPAEVVERGVERGAAARPRWRAGRRSRTARARPPPSAVGSRGRAGGGR